MNRMFNLVFTILLVYFISGCSNRNVNINPEIEKSLLQPETVDIYDINLNRLLDEKFDSREQIKKFPFVSLNPVIDYKGKFSNQFYDLKPYKVRAQRIDEVDFWKLQNNPYMIDFIYVLPVWVESFKRISNDLYQNIGYTYNLSLKEQEILKWWIEQGGVLWMETGIYTTLYDSYNKSGVINAKKAKKLLYEKSKNLSFLDKNLHLIKYESVKVDYINFKNREIELNVLSDYSWLNDINKLKIVVSNYAEHYFVPDGKVLLRAENGIPLITENQIGKGMIISMLPFTYNDTRFDGELLRWKVMEYALNTSVFNKNHFKIINENREVIELKPAKVEKINQNVKALEQKKLNDNSEVKIIKMTDDVSKNEVDVNNIVTEKQVKVINMDKLDVNTTEDFCIQLYSSIGKEGFDKVYNENKNVKNIRIEMKGKYYVLRAGRYDEYKNALNDLTYYKKYFPDSFVRKCSYK